MECNISKAITLTDPQGPVTCLTYPRRVREHGVEYRRQLARRTANHLEHFRSRCLLFQCLAQITGSLTQFVEQPSVLDRNDSLRGEVLNEFNLFIGEGAN